MTEHLTFDQLCVVADAEQSSAPTPADDAAARAHQRSCADCTARLSSISALAALTPALAREIAPPADLWSDIRAELTPRTVTRPMGAPVWRLRHLAAAAFVIAAASSSLTALFLRDQRRAPATEGVVATLAPPIQLVRLPARLASAEHGYTRSADALQRMLDDRRDSLTPSTVAIVERSLRIADLAIAEARDALARDPANRALAALFASNYERKIDLLRRATELAPRT